MSWMISHRWRVHRHCGLPIKRYSTARDADVVLRARNGDFVRLLERYVPPPRVLWGTCGNTSNCVLTDILTRCWPTAVAKLEAGEPLVEIAG